jgi:O-antigen ligase
MLFLYLVVCAFSFGLINLAPLLPISLAGRQFNAAEAILLIALLVLSLPAYLRQRRKLSSPWFHCLELAWLILIILLAVQSFRSPADSLAERLANMRFVQNFLLFFPSIAIMTSRKRLHIIAIIGVLFALIGTVMTIAQSIHGLENLFDSPLFDIGYWSGNKQYVAGIARVNLAISNWVAFVLLVLLAQTLLQFRWWHLLLGACFLITILLGFARLLWLGIIAAFTMEVFLLWRLGVLRGAKMFRLVLVPFVLALSIGLAQYLGFSEIFGALQEKLTEGIHYYVDKTGTWERRLEVMREAMELWKTNPWLGIGTAYYKILGVWIDLGLPTVLVSTGIIGLMSILYLFGICLLLGVASARKGVIKNSTLLIVIGVSVPAQVVLMLVYQQWLDPLGFAILGFASALLATGLQLFSSNDQDLAPNRSG